MEISQKAQKEIWKQIGPSKIRFKRCFFPQGSDQR